MRGFVSVTAAFLAASALAAGSPTAARANDDPAVPSTEAVATILYFSGADLWSSGNFVHGGLLWSPGGLAREGFTLKLLAGTGTYRYHSGAVGAEITGTQMLGSVMPGWRLVYDHFELTAYAGPDIQDHRLSPGDPGNRLQGTLAGVRVGADLWWEPLASTMLAGNISASTIGSGFSARLATGWRAFDAAWLGPEVQLLGDTSYRQYRLGAHISSFRTGAFEWSAGAGYQVDSDRRTGFYGRIGILTRR